MLVAVSTLVIAFLLILTMTLAKSAGEVSRHEEQAEMERWAKMKAAIEAERPKMEDAK